MHKDLEDILKISSCIKKKCNDEDTLFVLERICCATEEDSRKEKYDDFILRKNELIKCFDDLFGEIIKDCKHGLCDKCIISKWCNTYRISKQKIEEQRKSFIYADFFCGAGGLSLGFCNAGYKMSLANDIQECCIDTISLNHPEVPEKNVILGDINEVLEHVNELLRYNNVDVVTGGPPCQGFSMANRQRIIDDPRNHLYKSFVRAIERISPKFFVMENVRGMLNAKKQIIQDFERIGYSAEAHIVNARDFGIPQNRERVIFIGNKTGIDNERVFEMIFAEGNSKVSSVLIDAIEDLPKLSAKKIPFRNDIENDESGYTVCKRKTSELSDYVNMINKNKYQDVIFNHKARYNNERDIEIFRRLFPGDNSADPKIADIMPYKRREKIFKDKYYKLEPDKPCKTITAHMQFDCNMYIHPYQSRGLTPREAARIQSYPDDYFFRGSYMKTYMQVGNSVPPLLGEIIAKALKYFIEGG